MWDKFFLDNNRWVNYSSEHLISFLVFLSLAIVFISTAKRKWNTDQQHRNLLLFCLLLWFVQYAKVFIKIYLNDFDYRTDLPLELCNMLPIFMAVATYYRSRKWWGVLFIWIMIGTLQANFTTTLGNSFPHYEYFRYWIIHMGLCTAAMYGVIIFGYRANIKDGLRAFIWLNIVAWLMFMVNKILGSNYMYMQDKPPGETIYSLLKEWPYYLLQLEVVMWILILLVLIPFWLYAYFESRTTNKA